MSCLEIMAGVNYIAVIISVIVSMIIGMIWYSPKVFGTAWGKEVNVDFATMDKKAATRAMVGGIVVGVFEMLALAFIIAVTVKPGIVLGIHTGILVAVIVAAIKASEALYEGKSKKYWMITVGFRTTYLIIAGAIMGAMA